MCFQTRIRPQCSRERASNCSFKNSRTRDYSPCQLFDFQNQRFHGVRIIAGSLGSQSSDRVALPNLMISAQLRRGHHIREMNTAHSTGFKDPDAFQGINSSKPVPCMNTRPSFFRVARDSLRAAAPPSWQMYERQIVKLHYIRSGWHYLAFSGKRYSDFDTYAAVRH